MGITWTFAAGAHGPPASVTGVVAVGASGPTVVAVSEGFAQHAADAWRYVCPVQFGNELSPPAASTDGARTFVVGAHDLYTLGSDASVSALNRPDLAREFVLGLYLVNGGIYAFRFDAGQSQLVEIEPPASKPLWSDSNAYDSISPAADGFWLARAEGTVGHLARLDLGGQLHDARTFPLEAGDAIARVAEARGTLYVAVLTADLSGKLLALGGDAGATVLVSATAPVQGPITVAGSHVFAADDGVLAKLLPQLASPVSPDYASCVGHLGDFAYFCSRTTLFSLTASGPAAPLFALAGLNPPDLDRVNAGAKDACVTQWNVFSYDLRRIGVQVAGDGGIAVQREAVTQPSPRATSGGCAASGSAPDGAPSGVLVGVGIVALLERRRRRGRPAPPTTAR
jgi:MYXO-CTERM domain-containing protein